MEGSVGWKKKSSQWRVFDPGRYLAEALTNPCTVPLLYYYCITTVLPATLLLLYYVLFYYACTSSVLVVFYYCPTVPTKQLSPSLPAQPPHPAQELITLFSRQPAEDRSLLLKPT